MRHPTSRATARTVEVTRRSGDQEERATDVESGERRRRLPRENEEALRVGDSISDARPAL